MRNIFILVTLIIGVGCGSPTLPRPELSDQELVHIIADLHMAEVAAKKVHTKQKKEYLEKYYQQVFEIHHITREEFEKNFTILQQNPDLLTKIYDRALEYVTIMSKEE